MNGKRVLSVLLAVICTLESASGCRDYMCNLMQRKMAAKCSGGGLHGLHHGLLHGGGLPSPGVHCVNVAPVAPPQSAQYGYSLPIPISFSSPTPRPILQPIIAGGGFGGGFGGGLGGGLGGGFGGGYPVPIPIGLSYGSQDDVEFIPEGYCKCPKYRRHRYHYDC